MNLVACVWDADGRCQHFLGTMGESVETSDLSRCSVSTWSAFVFCFCFDVAGSLSHHFVCTWSHACDAISKAIDIAYLSLTMAHFLLISIKLNNLGYRCVVLPQDKLDPVNRYISCVTIENLFCWINILKRNSSMFE